MKMTFSLIGLLFILFSCNKDVNKVELGPVSASPNPFYDQFQLYVNHNLGGIARIQVKNGKDDVLYEIENVIAGNVYYISMSDYESGVYYIETKLLDETFIEPVIKAEQ